MEILQHFEDQTKLFLILGLKEADRDSFLKKLPPEYLECYIPDSELQKRLANFGSTKQNELIEILPSAANIRSGDFGEILSYFIIKERHKAKGVNGPKKWRWKQQNNVAAPYSDVVLFSIKDVNAPSKDDMLISVESKMKSTKNNANNPIESAIAGAEKDYISRIAHSLSWLKKKYKEEALKEGADINGLQELVRIMDRFIQSETIGEFTKEITAIAYVDRDFLDEEVIKPVDIPEMNGNKMQIIVVHMKDLKSVYEYVFDEIPKI